MDCAGVAEHLVTYHLGGIDDEPREAVEAHLVACRACLETYLALKRAADREGREKPRPEVKARLRAEVAREFAPKPSLFARRIPLYQGVALAAIAAAIAIVAPSVFDHVRGASEGPAIDTSRPHPESLNIY